MKKVFSYFIIVLSLSAVKAQTSDLGLPLSYSDKFQLPEKAVYELPAINNQEQLDFYTELNKNSDYKTAQYGSPHDVSLNFFEKAEIFVLPNGNNLYRLRVKSATAISLNVIFSKFHLAEGTILYLYAANKSSYVGAYTSINNNTTNVLGTDLLYTNDLIIEVQEPKENKNKSQLEIERLIHGFVHLGRVLTRALNSSGSCNIDVNCPQGSGWEICRNSVGVVIHNGGGYCTGTMLNNTSGSNIPYFLTANHCSQGDVGQWIYRFRWESPQAQADCGTSVLSVDSPNNYTINGGTLRSSSDQSDFKLIELNSLPDPTWEVIYAGWDNRNVAPKSGAGIHHPAGDIKKISLSYVPAITFSYNTFTNGHWKVFWAEGVTEGGSSGSGLFDQNRRVVGQLSGGASGCISSDQSDSYGKFFHSWTGKGTSSTRLSDWLDPGNTSKTFIDANVLNNTDPILSSPIIGLENTLCSNLAKVSIILTNGGTINLTSATITYTLDGSNLTYNWTGNLGLFETDTIILPDLIVGDGNHNFSAVVSNPNAGSLDKILTNNTVQTNFAAVTNGGNFNLELNLDCYGNETSWEITDLSNVVLHKSPAYLSTGSPQLINHQVCLNVGCYQMKIYDKLGDGMTASGCPSGSYYITDPLSADTLAKLIPDEANFGYSKVNPFCVTQIGIEELNVNTFQVYPNPFENKITVSGNEIIQSIMIYDLTGKIVLSLENLQNKKEIIDFQGNKGCYQVQVKTENSQYFHRIIKIN